MPLIHSHFRSPFWLPGGHLQTLLPTLRKVLLSGKGVDIFFADGDRTTADFYSQPPAEHKPPLMILTHGLEGSARQPYMLGMAKSALAAGYEVLAWNLRGCGPEDNLSYRMYHSGSSADLDDVVGWAEGLGYHCIYLVGFSLGGNITLKWAGEQGARARQRGVKAVCAASVPTDLSNCVDTLDSFFNWIYRQRFLRDMKQRLAAKARKFPGHIDLTPMAGIHRMRDYDNTYIGPLNGFGDAVAYHAACSSRFFLADIRVPTLLVNALNDPFFGEPCFPRQLAQDNPHFTLEISRSGGHVGFLSSTGRYWLEDRFLEFFTVHG